MNQIESYYDGVNMEKYSQDHDIKGFTTNISFLKSAALKAGDARIVSNKKAIIKLVAHYLMNEKNKKGLPINDVCRFHLGNGAIIDDININANVSEV